MRAFSPKEISKKKYEVIPWGEKWSIPFGKPAVNELWFISGASASGKSSFVMQLAKELCNYGDVLYLSYEEGISKSFQDRIKLFRMYEVQGRFRVVINDTYEEVVKRLQKHKSAHFVILDSLQVAGWSYDQMVELKKRFKSKSFIVISQERKSQPMGAAAVSLRYLAGIKIRVVGFKAFCAGRFTSDAGSYYTVWEEGVVRTSNQL